MIDIGLTSIYIIGPTYLYNFNYLAYFNRYIIIINAIASHYSNVSEFEFLLKI